MNDSLKNKWILYRPTMIAAAVGALCLILLSVDAIAGAKFLAFPIILGVLAIAGIGYAIFQTLRGLLSSDKERKYLYFYLLSALLLFAFALAVLACDIMIVVYHAQINAINITDIASEMTAIQIGKVNASKIHNTVVTRNYLMGTIAACLLASLFLSFISYDAEKQARKEKKSNGNE